MAAITGKVIDGKSGKPLYNATVVFTDKNGKPYSPLTGTVTGFNGGYSFNALAGYYIRVSYIGYKSVVKPITLKNFSSGGKYTQVINFTLQPTGYKLPEVVIHGGVKKSLWNRQYAWLAMGMLAVGYVINKNKGK